MEVKKVVSYFVKGFAYESMDMILLYRGLAGVIYDIHNYNRENGNALLIGQTELYL
jgi:hypothetical protein